MREDGGYGEAAGALDVHEEGAWSGDEGLELVLARLGGGGWVEEIDCEDLFCAVLDAGFHFVVGIEMGWSFVGGIGDVVCVCVRNLPRTGWVLGAVLTILTACLFAFVEDYV